MDSAVSSDESGDSELLKIMKNQLTEFGLEEDNLTKEEMSDLLKALNNSKATVQEDKMGDEVNDTSPIPSPKKNMKRKYLNVRDRRMPWSLFPNSLTQAEKAKTLAVYVKIMSLNSYRQARLSSNFMSWPPPLQIVEETARIIPLRSTRSGRSVPVYSGFDDDSSDFDFVVTKKKRKVSNSDHGNDGTSTPSKGKFISLKRKTSKEENNSRPMKEAKMSPEIEIIETKVSK